MELNGSTMNDDDFSRRLHKVIPGGAHTYSRGDDQYPSNAPKILERGKGAYVWSPDGRKFLDYGMALRAVNIGYAEESINQAAIRQIENGNNLTRPSTIELEAAELFVSLFDSVDMVKFTKNGSTATSAAVKLSRAFTKRDLVARCTQHPFFSYDDWFIGSTAITKGVPASVIQQTKHFNYNDIESLKRLIDAHPDQIACVILEPASLECPATPDHTSGCCQKEVCDRFPSATDNYLKQVQALCKKHGIVFILDEMITGFRWDLKGAQHLFGVKPDLCTFGKAMANGFSVAAVAGRRDIMEQGSIHQQGMERLFLLSTTHGAEMCGLGAFVETVKFIQRENVICYLWNYGNRFVTLMNKCADATGIKKHFKVVGSAVFPAFLFYNDAGEVSMPLRTLFMQEMIKHNVLMPWMAFSFRHGDKELQLTEDALLASMKVIKAALDEGIDKYLVGPVVKPVFRQYN
jgi:glutamate-1-semialdehyde 2,1-aminomutase